MKKLTSKVDHLTITAANKSDLAGLKEEVVKHTEKLVEETIAPIKHEMKELKSQLAEMKLSDPTEQLRKKILDDNDPAFKQIAFVGFKEYTPEKRLCVVKEFASAHFPSIHVLNVENSTTGPWNNRKTTDTTIMEFHSRVSRDAALKIVKNTNAQVVDGNTTVDLKIENARTRSQKARNWAFRKADEMLKVEMARYIYLLFC